MLRVHPLVLCLAAAGSVAAQGVREHTRLVPRGTAVSAAQAEALTLTVGAVTARLVQTWIRAAGTIDRSNKILSADLDGPDAAIVKVGQRVRAFPPSSKSSMYQAFVTRVTPRSGGATVEASLAASGRQNATVYVLEIVVEQGPFLSVPNEAIIEEGDRRVVYVLRHPGQYAPREIQTGLQGELYTQVLSGVNDGDQVVTFGSFFIDAEHKLKGTEQDSSGARQQ
jgi:Cu(I)/Ag(I) efflux system membrane fusion protein